MIALLDDNSSTEATNEESNPQFHSKHESFCRPMLTMDAKLSTDGTTTRVESERKTGPVSSIDRSAPLVGANAASCSDFMTATSTTQQHPSYSYFGISRTMGDNDRPCLESSGEPDSVVYLDCEGKSKKQKYSSSEQSKHIFQSTPPVPEALPQNILEAMPQNVDCPTREKVRNAVKIKTCVTERASNNTLHEEASTEVQVSRTCPCESTTNKRLATESLSPSPALHQSFAPVAPALHFYSNVPTPCGPASEFGVDLTQSLGKPWHRLQNKQSRDRHLRKWIQNAVAMQSWRESAYKNASNLETSTETDFTQNNWSDEYEVDTSPLRIPSLSQLVCSKEWEENFVQRMAASKKLSHENSGMGMSQTGGSTWWDGRTTIYSMAKDSLCEKLLFGDTYQRLNEDTPHDLLEQDGSPLAASRRNALNLKETAAPTASKVAEEKQNGSVSKNTVFTFCQTSLFEDNLRIKIDMGSQFAFALVCVWCMHYLYLCIIVYVLRDDGDSSPRRRGRGDPALMRDEPRFDFDMTDTSASVESRGKYVAYDRTAGEHTNDRVCSPQGRDSFNFGDDEALTVAPSKENVEQESVTSIASAQWPEITSDEDEARAAMGLPKFISIQQPSYLTTLCMLESDTDDDDSVLSYDVHFD